MYLGGCDNRWNGVSSASVLTLRQMALKLERSKKKGMRITKYLEKKKKKGLSEIFKETGLFIKKEGEDVRLSQSSDIKIGGKKELIERSSVS